MGTTGEHEYCRPPMVKTKFFCINRDYIKLLVATSTLHCRKTKWILALVMMNMNNAEVVDVSVIIDLISDGKGISMAVDWRCYGGCRLLDSASS